MTVKLFYQDYYVDQGIDASDAINVDLERAIKLFYDLTDEEGNFLGLIDELGICLQFIYEGHNVWYVEYIVQPNIETYSKKCSYDESVELIKNFYLKSSERKILNLFKTELN